MEPQGTRTYWIPSRCRLHR